MKPPFTLIKPPPCINTITTLEQLLEEARRGEIIGITFSAMLKERKFFGDVVGECRRNPVFASGMIAALDFDLQNLIHND